MKGLIRKHLNSIEIKTTGENIFNFLTGIVDDAGYRAWHQEDHVSFRWLEGEPWAEGSVMYAEEYLHGKLHKLKFEILKIIPNRRIEYAPASRFLRIYFPKNEFIIEHKSDSCIFIASGSYRVGKLGKIFFKKKLESGLSSIRKHMKEEGEYLKSILESQKWFQNGN